MTRATAAAAVTPPTAAPTISGNGLSSVGISISGIQMYVGMR